MISRNFGAKLFEAFSIVRWNDRIRASELVEMDKQALKCMLTYIIGKEEERTKGIKLDWLKIVHGCIYDFLKKLALSDIKSTVNSEFKNRPTYKNILNWAVNQYEWFYYGLSPVFLNDFRRYTLNINGDGSIESTILKAANKLATKRELDLIMPLNSHYPDIAVISEQVTNTVRQYLSLSAVNTLLNLSASDNLYKGYCYLDQLRNQVRWSQSPRVPRTNVMGHSMYTALLTYFVLYEKLADSPNKSILVNNFYAALFHDASECVVRDIISPVKRVSSEFEREIAKLEKELTNDQFLPCFPAEWRDQFRFILGIEPTDAAAGITEFSDRVLISGQMRILPPDVDSDSDPIYGTIIEVCDKIAAYMEADMSIQYGVTSKHLREGMAYVESKYTKPGVKIRGLDFSVYFADLRP